MGKEKSTKASKVAPAPKAAPVKAKPVKSIIANGKAASKEKKAKKAPTPPPPPETSSGESSEDEESEGSSTEPSPAAAAKVAMAKKEEASASSDEESEGDSDSDIKKAPAVVNKSLMKDALSKAQAVTKKGDSSSESSESDEGERPAKSPPKAAPAKALPETKKEDSGSESSEAEGSDSSSSSSDEKMEDAEKPQAAPAMNGAKRKADAESAAPAKKAKLDAETPATSAKIFIGKLSWNVDDEWLKSEFESFGRIVSANVAMDRESGKSKGFGFVEFETPAAAKAACSRDGSELDGREIKVNISEPKPNAGGFQSQGPKTGGYKGVNGDSEPTKTIFVGNLPWTINEDQLWEKFGEFGSVSSIRLPTDRDTGKPKGFGYVEYVSVEASQNAYEQGSSIEFEGRRVNLDYSRPRDPSERGGRGGGFGGRGGGRGGGDRGRGRGGRGGWGGRGRGGPPARSGAIQQGTGRRQKFD